MSASFIAYIDESGDEGFRFKDGSSEWFVLSAAIFRKSAEPSVVALLRNARQLLNKPANYTVHFRNLKHQQRIPYLDFIAKAQLRSISVVCHKKLLTESEYLQRKNRLYFFTARYLIERISWYCRDNRQKDDSGDGTVTIIFSNRSGMSYNELKEYLNRLKQNSYHKQNIAWSAINPDQIESRPHGLRAGLQVVDAIASSYFYAFEPSKYGFTEDKYVQMLMPVAYRHKGQLSGYGVKIWPREALRQVIVNDSYNWLSK